MISDIAVPLLSEGTFQAWDDKTRYQEHENRILEWSKSSKVNMGHCSRAYQKYCPTLALQRKSFPTSFSLHCVVDVVSSLETKTRYQERENRILKWSKSSKVDMGYCSRAYRKYCPTLALQRKWFLTSLSHCCLKILFKLEMTRLDIKSVQIAFWSDQNHQKLIWGIVLGPIGNTAPLWPCKENDFWHRWPPAVWRYFSSLR
jgi:hypothetical protein